MRQSYARGEPWAVVCCTRDIENPDNIGSECGVVGPYSASDEGAVTRWNEVAARKAELEEARRRLAEFDADKNTGECPYSRERLGCAVLHQFKARIAALDGGPTAKRILAVVDAARAEMEDYSQCGNLEDAEREACQANDKERCDAWRTCAALHALDKVG